MIMLLKGNELAMSFFSYADLIYDGILEQLHLDQRTIKDFYTTAEPRVE